jgi:hypothetical protein
MGFKHDPGRENRQDEQEALEEFHRLFARKRQTARHGRVTEHDEPPETRAERQQHRPASPRR